MSAQIGDEEMIIRRLLSPPPDGAVRAIWRTDLNRMTATSAGIEPREGEPGVSWARASECSPELLLEFAKRDEFDIRGASVCQLNVGVVRRFGLDVIDDPNTVPGHCLITWSGEPPKKKLWSKLAKETSIVFSVPNE